MKRREFITLLGGAAAAWPLAARAQQAAKVPRIGYWAGHAFGRRASVAALCSGCGELGWIESRNVAIEYPVGGGPHRALAELAAEFVRLNVDVIAQRRPLPLATKQATAAIDRFSAAGTRSAPA